jgi:hypothetical protein
MIATLKPLYSELQLSIKHARLRLSAQSVSALLSELSKIFQVAIDLLQSLGADRTIPSDVTAFAVTMETELSTLMADLNDRVRRNTELAHRGRIKKVICNRALGQVGGL